MLKSMTGYGKAQCLIGADKYLVEIRSVNGKTADITFKTQLIPRDREPELRKYIAEKLNRGNIDLFITVERAEGPATRQISRPALLTYYDQLQAAVKGTMLEYCDPDVMLSSLMRLPDVLETTDTELSAEAWETLYAAIRQAVADLDWPVLIVFGLGCVVGILAFSKFLHWLLGRFEKQTMLVLLGFVLGSLVKVWPWANESVKALPEPHYGAAALWCVLGFALVLGIEGFAKRSKNS